MDTLANIVKKYWGYDQFMPLQREAMECVTASRDSVVILPTGGGKSLCFQAPALAMDGMAVVVSPLLSLMKDQVDALCANGIAAAKIDSTMTSLERQEVHAAIQAKSLKLLYVSPERMAQSAFTEYLSAAGVSFIVIDEAHCISQWGHDFRPEYRELRRLRQAFPDKAIHAYTATATPHVREDIVNELCLSQPQVLCGAFDRPNLTYRVARRADGFTQVRRIVDEHPGESGIVYCIRRSEVDTMCKRLVASGYKALPYHAGMDDKLRKRNQEAFSRDEADIVVATVAFGMGIDKSNVRYVVHTGMPKSIEHYHQETGRAGRDQLPADCWLFYSYADFRLWQSIMEKSDGQATGVAQDKLRDMLQYCEKLACRHKTLVNYFGQAYDSGPCDACDICLGHEDAAEDAAELARTILSCVAELGPMAGPTYTTLILAGSREERVLAKGHDKLSSYGALANNGAPAAREWVEQLVQQGCLEKTGEYNVLALTAHGADVMRGEASAQLLKASGLSAKTRTSKRGKTSAGTPAVPLSPVEIELFDALRRARREKAEEMGVPPFVVFGDASLRDMARLKPTSREAFLAVSGVGQHKCDTFGDQFTGIIAQFLEENDIDAPPAAPLVAQAKEKVAKRRTDTYEQSVALFEQSTSIGDAAEILNRQPSTIWTYLYKYVGEKKVSDPTPWVSSSVAQEIREIMDTQEDARLKPVYERLEGRVPYEEIRLCMQCLYNERRHLGNGETE